jgi:hypothetical protein
MSHTTTPHSDSSDSLQQLRDELQHHQASATAQKELLARRETLSTHLAEGLSNLAGVAGFLLTREEQSRTESYLANVAAALLGFGRLLREADEVYPRFRILERLRRATSSGVPGLDTAASLLLVDHGVDSDQLVRDLQQLQASPGREAWPMWVTYIFDQLMCSNCPPGPHNVPPDTTRDEWRRAELAFGCILFTDDSFRVLQESVDRAASQIDHALSRGGYKVLGQPPGRVRDLIATFDSRAMAWYATDPEFPGLVQPPPAIEAIAKPRTLRRQLDEVWTAAVCLQLTLDKWADWFVELQEKGDAPPGVALNCMELASRSISVLIVQRPAVSPFDVAGEAELLAMLPPIPSWQTGVARNVPPSGGKGMISQPRVRWQVDREFLDQYYRTPDGRQDKALKLRGAAVRLMELLKSFPTTVLMPRPTPSVTQQQPARLPQSVQAHHVAGRDPAGDPQPGWPWPLVGERTGRRDPLPELARDPNRDRQSRYCQGFDPDWWVPAKLAGKWRSPWYPRDASRESVQQWRELIDRMCVEQLGPFANPEGAAELEAAVENDLAVIKKVAPQLLAGIPASCSGLPSTAPQPSGDLQDVGPSSSERSVKPKRSTEKGEARPKLIAALIAHHQYDNGSCLNTEPIGNNDLARKAGVSDSTASAFFEKEFEGHTKYKATCKKHGMLINALKMLNNEFPVHILYGKAPDEATEPRDNQ